MSDGVRCMWMRGGTSKGGFFLAQDLPDNRKERDAFLLSVLGSPDPRQIDGMGGADPLTSKVAVVRPSKRPGVDVDYLFLQVFVDRAVVTSAQNCGNMLAGVGPFAIERGLVRPAGEQTRVVIHLDNTDQIATATVNTPSGHVTYDGDTRIDGVPQAAAPISLTFNDNAGSSCGALLPSGHPYDRIAGVDVTLIDNGMPCALLLATDLGVSGYEPREVLEQNLGLTTIIEDLRVQAGQIMGLGDVRQLSVPKMVLLAPPLAGGDIHTRSFIPHRVHASIGVLAAVTVATACIIEDSIATKVCSIDRQPVMTLAIEHPTGTTPCVVQLDDAGRVVQSGILRTARKLFDGCIFPHASVLPTPSHSTEVHLG